MTEYPSIDPADVREGDVVEATYRGPVIVTRQGLSIQDSEGADACPITWDGAPEPALTDLRLISRPAPPEPPLRVGDWVRTRRGRVGQITKHQPDDYHTLLGLDWHSHELTRIEPPVGWPVGVRTEDGGVVWWTRFKGTDNYMDEAGNVMSWAELLAAGGIPALAPGGAA